MIQVKRMVKTTDKKTSETVRKVQELKKIKREKSYKDYINSISKSFGINYKKIALIGVTDDDDEFAINNQEDLDENIEDIKEFIIYLEDNEINDLSKKSSEVLDEQKGPKEEKDEHSVHSQNLEDNDEDDFKIDIKVDLDMSDKEIENILNSQIKLIPEGNNKIKDDISFDKEKYEKELDEKYSKAINDFQNVFENKIITIVSDKKN